LYSQVGAERGSVSAFFQFSYVHIIKNINRHTKTYTFARHTKPDTKANLPKEPALPYTQVTVFKFGLTRHFRLTQHDRQEGYAYNRGIAKMQAD
jgi:hypothetical protein